MIKVNGQKAIIKAFPNGELYVDMLLPYKDTYTVDWFFDGRTDELFVLKGVVDLIDKRNPNARTILFAPYLPYSRMDRQENNRMFSLKAFADILNTMDFDKVVSYEVHSQESFKLINNLQGTLTSAEMAQEILEENKDKVNVIVMPDKGAYDRYKDCFQDTPTIHFEKKRDFDTGMITGLELAHDSVELVSSFTNVDNFIIVDDLCAGGRTFSTVAEILKRNLPKSKVTLVVTHCEEAVKNIDKKNLHKIVVVTDSLLHTVPKELTDKLEIVHTFREV